MAKAKIEEKKEEKQFFRVDISQEIPLLPDYKNKEETDVRYPLIAPYAYAHIYWDKEESEVIYKIEEPELNDREKKILEILEEGVRELINLSFIAVKEKNEIISYLEKNVRVLLNELAISISSDSFLKLMYYIYRDFVGLNEMEPLMNDYHIEDIECNGVNSPIYVVHRKYRNLRTSLIYPELKDLTSFVEKLAQKCGKYISYANPLLDGTLPDNSRVNATYTQEISSKGPAYTIRRFTKEPWSPVQMMEKGTISAEILAYIWLLVEYEKNIMVIGGTGSGKTTLLNMVAFFIPPQARIVSIEDTKEINLVHENWLPSVARAGIGLASLTGQKQGEVSLFDLLKESFRQRPDYVIVGEVRGVEAYVLFQGMSSIEGNEKILVLNNHHLKKIKIKNLKNKIKYSALTIDPITGKSGIFSIRRKIIHPNRIELYKIKTKTGREITLTPNHSLFTYNNGIQPIFVNKLNIGDKIIIPAKLPCNYANEDYINLIEYLPKIRIFAPEYIKEAVRKLGYEPCNKLCKIKSITDYYSNFKRSKPSAIKANKFLRLMKKAKINYNLDKIKVRFDKKSKDNPIKLKISDEFLRLLGYSISEGSLDLNKSSRISLYSKNEKILEDMRKCILSVAGINPKERKTYGFGSSTELSFNHKIIFEFLKKYCGTNSKNKKIPEFIFGLSKERIGQFLSALYDGDGSLNKNSFGYYTISRELANDITQLLLVYNIVAKIRSRKRRKNRDYEILFYRGYEKKNFLEFVRPLKLKKFNFKIDKLNEDYFIDKIKDIKKLNLNKPKPVYDISVDGPQSFIGGFGGILLHNSGHPSMGTMHAEDVRTLIRRLETPPINLSPALVESMDAVCIMSQTKVGGKAVRRVSEVDEIVEVKEGISGEKINAVFIWDPRTDKFNFRSQSKVFEKIMVHYGINKEKIYNEFKLRAMLLMKLYQQRIFGFKEVQKIINEYYKSPEVVLKRFKLI